MDVLLDLSFTQDQRGWVALLIALVSIAYLLFGRRSKKADPLDKPVFGSLSQQRSVERQMQNLLVELSDMSRQMSAQLDTRATKLELLIRNADERIAALRRHELAAGPEVGAPPKAALLQASLTAPQPPSAESGIPTAIDIDPRHAEIYTLADQGKGPKEIAASLGRPSGEIELILALRQRA